MAEASGYVLVHGAWHDRHTWEAVVPPMRAAGRDVAVLDLPGAGETAAVPESYRRRPLDMAAFASEPSPNAGVTQDQRTDAVIAALRDVNARTGGRAVLVGHSLGGLTVSHVAERVPEELSAAVYLTAFLLAPGVPAVEMIGHPLMARALVPSLFLADPEQVGALRIDPASEDPDYVERMRLAYAGDVTPEAFAQALRHFHPDEPAQVALVPSPVTAERFGCVPRHYVECTGDRAITIEGQREMVARMDREIGGATQVHTLGAAHSPFLSLPREVASLLLRIEARPR
ncbi:alpha/beta fold hydrolase [Psychromarinibacter sp. C21-152]|uniref:Alpha/beta fold hydrolase n=1 Tax=Psychromarinibacter sediminicola TaxID=3033385 RepID=A0AAE3NTX0_9RHOB|nr:alpha/beta fold hydrolase [Psychromarinibacter sediminicola]MDF0602376.1 alpha/beta fold hydrolase [Psychromarinibacter sediminicola]